MIEMLIVSGADVDLAVELNKQQNGFTLGKKELDYICKAQNMRKILLIKKLEEKSKRIPEEKKFLNNLNLLHL